jgi:hypothetical protein
MNFSDFNKKMQQQFSFLEQSNKRLFVVDIPKNVLFEQYLACFENQTERQFHNCSCCRQFLNNYGNVIGVDANGNYQTIWDFEATGVYFKIPETLRNLVLASPIKSVFINEKVDFGVESNLALKDGKTIQFNHLSYSPKTSIHKKPNSFLKKSNYYKNYFAESKTMFETALKTLSLEQIDLVLTKIASGDLYRGNQYASNLIGLKQVKLEVNPDSNRNTIYWELASRLPETLLRIKNTSIGALLEDLSSGMVWEVAKSRYDVKVSATNYRRSTADISSSQIDLTMKKLQESNLMPSLYRRHATILDFPIKNALYFAHENKISGNAVLDAFSNLTSEVKIDPKKDYEVLSFADLLEKLKLSSSLEIYVSPELESNKVSLLTAREENPEPLFNWDNNFSWTYNNNLTDSLLAERVKAAGGDLEGEVRFSLGWFNTDDLDLGFEFPDGDKIYFGNKSCGGGVLDIDMNAYSNLRSDAVENIVFKKFPKEKPGLYKIYVHNYRKRERTNVGFEFEMALFGETKRFVYAKDVRDGEKTYVAAITISREGEFKVDMNTSLVEVSESVSTTKSKFYKVNLICKSPNFWDGNKAGLEHIFFFLENYQCNRELIGFFNEYLRSDLNEYRKVFEKLSNQLMVPPSKEPELTGLGFSISSKIKPFLVRVDGKRIFNVVI